MAAKKEKVPADKMEGRVELFIEPTDSNDDPNELISVNGKNYVIPKGQTVFVPPEVYAEYTRARKARKKYFDLVNERVKLAQ